MSDPAELPRINEWLVNGFLRHFLPRYLRKHFHVVAANRSHLTSAIISGDTALVVYCNHASWWDPMLAMFVRSQLLPNHHLYAPIDSDALEQYKIFKSMGFYGVSDSYRGAGEFLRRSKSILQTSGTSIWITPEGKFCDARNLDEPLQPGLAHLAHGIASDTNLAGPDIWFVPAAIEYPFWEERSPECLCWFGEPVQVRPHSQRQLSGTEHFRAQFTKAQWQQLLTDRLREAQRALAAASIARDTSQFELLLHGSTGSWSIYDAARRTLARLRGQQISLDHSRLWKQT